MCLQRGEQHFGFGAHLPRTIDGSDRLGELLHRLQRPTDLEAIEPDYAEQSL